MNTHPYLRAYLGGASLPTMVLPLLLLVFVEARIVLRLPVPIEQVMIFPMAVVPMLFGLWNMLYVGSHARTHLSIGVYGAVLPVLMAPAGALVAHSLGVLEFGHGGVTWFQSLYAPYVLIAPNFLGALAIYYLLWKYLVGFMNRVLGIA